MNCSFVGLRVLTPLLVCCAGGLTAQQAGPDSSDDSSGTSLSASSVPPPAFAYTPLDLKQKYLYSLNEVAGPARWIGFAVHAAVDQAQESPGGWGTGPDSFGVRMANAFGRSLLRANVAFGVSALDHEDPRYFRMETGPRWTRAKYALSRAFVARRDDGGWMPAYSRFVADYSSPFIAQTWRPEHFSAGRGLRGGTVTLGLGMGANLWHEFWPDLKQKIRKGVGQRRAITAIRP